MPRTPRVKGTPELDLCARMWRDDVYRSDWMLAICAPEVFHATVRRLLRAHRVEQHIAEEIIGHLAGHTLEGCNGRAFRLPSNAHGYSLVIVWCRPGAGFDTLVHEIWHAAFWVFRSRGVMDLDEGMDEPMAYYLAWAIRSAGY